MGLNCYQPFSEGICVGSRCFFAALWVQRKKKHRGAAAKDLLKGLCFLMRMQLNRVLFLCLRYARPMTFSNISM